MLDTDIKLGVNHGMWWFLPWPLNLHYIHEVNRTGRFVKWTTQNHHFRFTAGFWSNNLLFYSWKFWNKKSLRPRPRKFTSKNTPCMDPFLEGKSQDWFIQPKDWFTQPKDWFIQPKDWFIQPLYSFIHPTPQKPSRDSFFPQKTQLFNFFAAAKTALRATIGPPLGPPARFRAPLGPALLGKARGLAVSLRCSRKVGM